MASYLITGSSRGLGLALVSRLMSLPRSEVGTIFATVRKDSSPQLKEIANLSDRVEVVKLDVTDKGSAEEATRTVESKLHGKGLDYLINNAGVADWSANGLKEMDNLNEIFNTNVTCVHQVTRAFMPLLHKGEKKAVINISTSLGSISRAPRFAEMKSYAYKISKAALNMLNVQYAQEHASEGFTFLAISPGWLRTDLGSSRADLPVEIGAANVLDIVDRAKPELNGKFLNILVDGDAKYRGEEIEW